MTNLPIPTWLRFLVFAAGIVLLVSAFDWLITTDEEEIEEALDGMSREILARDAEAAVAGLADDFDQDGVTKPAILANLRRLLKQSPPQSLEWIQRTVEMSGQTGSARIRIRYFPAPPSPFPYPIDTVWTIGFSERGDSWKIVRITPVEIAGQRAPDLPRVMRMANTARISE